MVIRFRRTFKLFPGVKINIGKNSISTSIGVRGAHLTFGKNGTYIGTGIPGTGISQRTKLSGPGEMKRKLDEGGDQTPEVAGQGKHYKLGVVFWLIFGTLVLALLQSPTILECYWVFIAAFVLLRFVVRSVRGKSRVGPGNDITSK